jgi:hypothetical protein
LRVLRQEFPHLSGERRRGDRFGQDSDARTLAGLLSLEQSADRGAERAERKNVAKVGEVPRAIRIVKAEDRRLRVQIGRPAARRVIGVAFDLGRPPFMALHEQAEAGAAHRHRRRKEERFARDLFFRLANVRDDFFVRLPSAGAHARQRERRAHQLEKTASSDRIEPFGGVLGKFAVEEFLEFGGLGERFETAPVLAASRAFKLDAQSLDVVELLPVRLTHR